VEWFPREADGSFPVKADGPGWTPSLNNVPLRVGRPALVVVPTWVGRPGKVEPAKKLTPFPHPPKLPVGPLKRQEFRRFTWHCTKPREGPVKAVQFGTEIRACPLPCNAVSSRSQCVIGA